jgi:hypothetical protein
MHSAQSKIVVRIVWYEKIGYHTMISIYLPKVYRNELKLIIFDRLCERLQSCLSSKSTSTLK